MAWQKALDTYLVVSHEALRSVFVSVDGQPQVRLLSSPIFSGVPPLSQYDLRGLRMSDVVLGRLSVEEAHASFDLESGPLIRAALIRISDDEYQFLLTLAAHYFRWLVCQCVDTGIEHALYGVYGRAIRSVAAVGDSYPDYACLAASVVVR